MKGVTGSLVAHVEYEFGRATTLHAHSAIDLKCVSVTNHD